MLATVGDRRLEIGLGGVEKQLLRKSRHVLYMCKEDITERSSPLLRKSQPPISLRTTNLSLHISKKILEPRERLLPTRHNLTSRQHKPITARIAQLNRKRILRLRNIVHIIHTGPCGLVDGGADGAVLVGGAVDSGDGGGDALG
jgi:hypothetical protein